MAAKRSRLNFTGGVIKDATALAAEGAFTDALNARATRVGPDAPTYVQSMGGYEAITPTPFDGIARGAHAWTDRYGSPLLAWSTAAKVYGLIGGAKTELQNKWGEFFLTDPIATENGTPTLTFTWNVYDPDQDDSTIAPHGLVAGDVLNVDHCSAIGGVTPAGAYTVVEILTETTFTVTHGSNASSTASMSGAAKVWVTINWRSGLVDGLGGLGYGTGGYGLGPYGLPNITDYQPRVGFLDNFRDRLQYVPSGGPLFEFQPAAAYSDLLSNGSFTGSATGWALGTGWAYSANTIVATAGTASNASQAISDRVEGGRTYRLTFDLTASAGAVYVGVNAGDPAAVVRLSPDITANGSYSLLIQMPAQPVDLVFAKSNTFAGSLDNVEFNLEDKLYRINEAPIASNAMFVDPHGVVVLMGTFRVDGVYDPMAVRTCDRYNNRSWVPDNSNLASEQTLANGGRCVGGLPGRSQNHLWTNTAIYSMRWTGTNGSPFTIEMAGSGCGLIAPLAMQEQGGFVFWMSNSGQFYGTTYDFQGAVPRPIECPSLSYVFDSLTPAQTEKIWATVNIKHNEISWQYPRSDGADQLEPNAQIIYNITTQQWWTNTLARSAGVKAGVFADPIMISYYDDGGSDKGKLYFHERGTTADGGALPFMVTAAPFDAQDGDRFIRLSQWSIDMKEQLSTAYVTFYGQDEPRGPIRTFGPYTLAPGTTMLQPRVMARRIWFKVEADAAPMSMRFGAIDLYMARTGVGR